MVHESIVERVQAMLLSTRKEIIGRDSQDDRHVFSDLRDLWASQGVVVAANTNASQSSGTGTGTTTDDTSSSPSSCCDDTGTTGNNNNNNNKEEDWYARTSTYYNENCTEDLDGVLGGYASISDIDLEFSTKFLMGLREDHPSMTMDWSKKKQTDGNGGNGNGNGGVMCECGAGIGRVTRGLLLKLDDVERCDLIESSELLLSAAPDYIGDDPRSDRCRYYCQELQHWTPKSDTYSIIWIQWVLCYLTDDDVVSFLVRCGKGLVKKKKHGEDGDGNGGGGGVIILKENACRDDESTFVLDRDDASVTRCYSYWLALIELAGLEVIKMEWQTDFPEELFPVPVMALQVKQ